MRRILKKVAAGEFDDLVSFLSSAQFKTNFEFSLLLQGDITTLSDPTVVQEVIHNHKKIQEKEIK